ncbi:hypothetical protein FALBO_10933 [Fusarium albosuccineum]|uniref:Uncharacterized protein n=1 Tax=Fusarium albosuccineum TaxID=1237068 RepID=A0A8H4L642_9HYPO|nr:hypothetical protein FALBO_10933 [Fusarium albosuccineum]
MSTSEWLGKVTLIEQAVAQCKAQLAETKLARDEKGQDEKLREVMATLCHDFIGVIGRPQVERSLRAWSDGHPQQQNSPLMAETGLYRHMGKRRERSWDPSESWEYRRVARSGAPSSPPYSDYTSHLPPETYNTPNLPSLEIGRLELGGGAFDPTRILPPIHTLTKETVDLPPIHSLRRNHESTCHLRHKILDEVPIVHRPHLASNDRQEPLPLGRASSRSSTSPPRSNHADQSDYNSKETSSSRRIPGEVNFNTAFYEFPDALAQYLEQYLAERGSPLHMGAFRDLDVFYNCPFCSQRARRNYHRAGPFADHLVRHWDSFRNGPGSVSFKK